VIVGGGYAMVRLFPQLESTGPWIAATAYIAILGVVLAIRFERGGWKRLHLLER
jgi:Na+-driven multidrug efflux pump